MPTLPFGLTEFNDVWVYRARKGANAPVSTEVWSKTSRTEDSFPPGPVDRTHAQENYGRWRAENLPPDHPQYGKALERMNAIALEKIRREAKGPPEDLINVNRLRVLNEHAVAGLAKRNAKDV